MATDYDAPRKTDDDSDSIEALKERVPDKMSGVVDVEDAERGGRGVRALGGEGAPPDAQPTLSRLGEQEPHRASHLLRREAFQHLGEDADLRLPRRRA